MTRIRAGGLTRIRGLVADSDKGADGLTRIRGWWADSDKGLVG